MHMIFRMILIFLRRKWLAPARFNEKTVLNMRVLPTDLDFLWHVNNGVYFSLMDFGRLDMIFRTGVFQKTTKLGWYSVVAGETIKFKKSLKLWDKFQIQTQVVGYDERYFFIQQRFMCKGQLMATGLVRARFLKKTGGGVNTKEVQALFPDSQIDNRASEISSEWFNLENKYTSL